MVSFFFSSRRRHTRFSRDWSSDVCSSDLEGPTPTLNMSKTERNIGFLSGRAALGRIGVGGSGEDGVPEPFRKGRGQRGASRLHRRGEAVKGGEGGKVEPARAVLGIEREPAHQRREVAGEDRGRVGSAPGGAAGGHRVDEREVAGDACAGGGGEGR